MGGDTIIIALLTFEWVQIHGPRPRQGQARCARRLRRPWTGPAGRGQSAGMTGRGISPSPSGKTGRTAGPKGVARQARRCLLGLPFGRGVLSWRLAAIWAPPRPPAWPIGEPGGSPTHLGDPLTVGERRIRRPVFHPLERQESHYYSGTGFVRNAIRALAGAPRLAFWRWCRVSDVQQSDPTLPAVVSLG